MYSGYHVGNYVSFEGRFYKIINIRNNKKSKVYYEIEDLSSAKRIELGFYLPEPISIDPYTSNIINLQYGDDVATAFLCDYSFNYIHELQNAYKSLFYKDMYIPL